MQALALNDGAMIPELMGIRVEIPIRECVSTVLHSDIFLGYNLCAVNPRGSLSLCRLLPCIDSDSFIEEQALLPASSEQHTIAHNIVACICDVLCSEEGDPEGAVQRARSRSVEELGVLH